VVSELPADVALSVEALGRRDTDIHRHRYRPMVSIGTRLRGRREGLPVDLASDFIEEDDEDEEDEEIGLEPEPEHDWTLQGVSFAVRQGEALGLIGDRATIVTLMRVLVGMTAPTEGRFLYRGRAGMSTEMAITLGRREMGADLGVGLRTLALLAGVSRLKRKAWVREVKALVDGTDGPALSSGSKASSINLAISASLDPMADVLFVDRLPKKGNDGLLERCEEQIRRRLAAGAAAIIAAPDTQVVERLCARAVRLDAGQVVEIGPAPEVIAGMLVEEQPRRVRRLKPFNSDAAIMLGELVDWSDRPTGVLLQGGPFRALARIETARPDTEVRWRVTLDGTERTSFDEQGWQMIEEPGAFLVTLELPLAEWEDAEYELSVDATVRVDGRAATVRRGLPGRFAVKAATAAERVEGVFDPTRLTATWERIDASAGETLVGT
jgi:lipopolysaccharide transport system ATP-binding protein